MEKFTGRMKEYGEFGYCLFGIFILIVIIMSLSMILRDSESYATEKK